MYKVRNKIEKLLLYEISIVVLTTYIISWLLKQFDLLTFFNLLLIVSTLFLIIKYFKNLKLKKIFTPLLLTVVFMNWTIAITGLEYLVYEFDWNSFGIPINLINDPDLYSSDILSKQSFPHFWIYKLVSNFVETEYLSSLFYLGYVFQNYFIAKTFLILYQSVEEKYSQNNHALFCVIVVPMLYYPQISGHYTALPYFIPAILGYALAIFNLANFIYKDKHTYEDYFYLLILFFIHPFWSIFIPLYLGICYLFSKEKKLKESFLFFIFFLISLAINNLDGVSILEILNSSLIPFYKSYIKIHFDWSAHIGIFFTNELNNIYQQSVLILFSLILLIKKKILSFKTTEETFYSSLGLISLVIIFGNIFYSSQLNNFLIASNFYRIGSICWAFIGIFILKNIESKKFLYFLSITPLLFYLFSSSEVFKINIPSIPWIAFRSKYLLLLLAISICFMFLEKYKHSYLVLIIGLIYFTTFYFIDKVQTDNYLFKSLIIGSIILLISLTATNNFSVESYLLPLMIVLFTLSTLFTENIFLNLKYEYSTQINKKEIEIIRKYTDKKSVILVNPNIPHFRKETKRGILIDYALIPYNEKNYITYKRYQNLFQNKFLEDLSTEEVINIIKNSNTTDIIIPKDSKSERYFLNKYVYYELGGLGYLILDVNN